MLAKETVAFLRKLEKNNDRDWFAANKDAYVAANDNVIAMAGELIGRIAKFDPAVGGLDPKNCVFRIYRDVRFSKDKSPYKTNMGAFIAPGGRKAMSPGYYFHIQPKMYFAAAGKHMPDAAELLKIRKAVSRNFDAFKKIVEAKKFKNRFGELHGEQLSRPPKGFVEDDPAIEYLKFKSFTTGEEFTEKKALSDEYLIMLAESFKASYPLVEFLREAL
ncbi:MAG: DUF2461 domain-containing protein [Acidobacteria bacterium]|nr:DUF2461 domain-containing protein [Acidobacteriota bacterium]